MTPQSVLLLTTQLGQAALALVLAGLLFRFHATYQSRYLRDWAASWAAMFLFMVCAAGAMTTARTLGAQHLVVQVFALVGALAGYLQIAWLLVGTAEVATGHPLPARVRNRVTAAAVVVALVTVSLFATSPAASIERFFVRAGFRTLVAGLAFIGVAIAVWRVPRVKTWIGPRLLSVSFLLYGAEQLHYLVLTSIRLITRGPMAAYVTYLGVGDLILNGLMALGMVVWLLEEERDRAVRLEERMAQAEKLESLGVLAGGVAHDFNNLLTGIVTNSTILAEDLPDAASRRSAMEIHDLAVESAALARQMLVYAGRDNPRKEPVDVSDIVLEVTDLLKTVVARDTKLEYQLAPGLPPAIADAGQMRQVVMNLITNASEALAGREGTVVVSTGRSERFPDRDHLLAGEPDAALPCIWLSVVDTGGGMSDEVRGRMFDPYFTTKARGRGLGLAAVVGIVRDHGGAIAVDTQLGTGTTVRVFLPAAPGIAPKRSAVERTAAPSWRGSGTVLVVDDEPSVRNATQRVLESAGFSVQTAPDGRAALDTIELHPTAFVAVVLDLVMPRLDGRQTFETMRRSWPGIPVLVFSGYATHRISDWLTGQPRAAFLPKPFEPAQLVNALRVLVS